MSAASRRIPDFAGVALVDILANGVGMLVIVVVISIAARVEREERESEKVEEISTVMSRQISTSLVLNTLAASRAARLHDYENSPIDSVLDPDVMPIIELHRDYVREYYTGALWTRAHLLEEPNGMDLWLLSMGEDTRRRLRMDIYDIGQYYLVMSILRAHGVAPGHWHFLGGALALRQAGACPPGVAAEDCLHLSADQPLAGLPGLDELLGTQPDAEDGDWLSEEALAEIGRGGGGDGDGDGDDGDGMGMAGPMPGGVVPGGGALGSGAGIPGEQGGQGGQGGGDPASGLPDQGRGMGLDFVAGGGSGQYPSARQGDGWGSGEGADGEGQGQGAQNQTRFRLAFPEELDIDLRMLVDRGQSAELIAVLSVIMGFLSELQASIDSGGSPSRLLPAFRDRMVHGFRNPPDLPDEYRDAVEALAFELIFASESTAPGELEPISLRRIDIGAGEPGALLVEPNHLLQEVAVMRPGDGEMLWEDTARVEMNISAHPAVWQGLRVDLDRNSVLMAPPTLMRDSGWRAVASISPAVDDFIVGFVQAGVGRDGTLVIDTDGNRVRIDRRPLVTPYRPPLIGARGWTVALFAGLAVALGLLVLARGRIPRLWAQ